MWFGLKLVKGSVSFKVSGIVMVSLMWFIWLEVDVRLGIFVLYWWWGCF